MAEVDKKQAFEQEKLAAQLELEGMGYTQELKRSLTVFELTAYAVNYMIPLAPAVVFGVILAISGGSVGGPYALAGLVMLFTASTYALMVRNFPLAGSLYSYVSRGINPYIGFLSGWILLLDYIFIPTVTALSATAYIMQFFPAIPFWLILIVYASAMGLFNLFGVELMAKMGLWLVFLGEAVVFIGIYVWARYVLLNGIGGGNLLSAVPFHTASTAALISATAIAVLSYTGFDAVTTFAEETANPKRDLPRAIYWSIFFGALSMVGIGYFGMLVVPNWQQLITQPGWQDTAVFHICEIAGGKGFAAFYSASYLLGLAVFNIVATAAGARLLYGMGRDGVLPKKIFAAINKKYQTPHWNILLIVVIEIIMAFSLSIEGITNLINFGALGGFTMLNISVIWLYYGKKKGVGPVKLGEPANWAPPASSWWRYFLIPSIATGLTAILFVNLSQISLIIGFSWLAVGITYEAIKTKGFKEAPPNFDM